MQRVRIAIATCLWVAGIFISIAPAIAAEGPERFSLETGYRTTQAGPVMVTRDGRVLWITAGASGELDQGTFQISREELRESRDSGRTWGPPRAWLWGTKEASLDANALLQLASGKLLLIGSRFGGYSRDSDPDKSLNEGFTQVSTDGGDTWGELRTLPTGERYLSSVLSAAQLSGGRVIFPFGYLTKEGPGRFKVSVVYSDDDGETWHRSQSVLDAGGHGFESGACEPSVVELPDGRVWMLIRAQTGFQWESFSSDRGATWEPARPSRFPSSNAPAVLLRLRSGQIVVAWNPSVRSAYARQSLVMAASDDGGRTFYGFREIARADYPMCQSPLSPEWCVTYPELAEAPDGKVLVAYNYGCFNQAKLVRIDPAWLKEGSLVENFRDGDGAWCRLGATGNHLALPEDDEPGVSVQVDYQQPGPSGTVRNFPLLSQGEMRLTLTVLKPQAYLLWHNSFLDPGQVDEACLRVRFADNGQVFVAAGTPRTKDLGQAGRGPAYSYLAFPIEKETAYPTKIKLGERFTVRVQYDIARSEARVSINDGTEVKVPLGNILGLCYLGIAATDDGSIRLRKFEAFQR
jgi:hypothetical protein